MVAKSLKQHGFNASPIHGDLEQSQRMKTLDGFRDGSLHLLVAPGGRRRGPRRARPGHAAAAPRPAGRQSASTG
ncbi:helicase-related protein [Cereibacter sphaeroides]|uniref:helicase-related protein n=1 Tax=Cereibacter sphaeroides TaxID=1063 RepID=UPI002F924FBD